AWAGGDEAGDAGPAPGRPGGERPREPRRRVADDARAQERSRRDVLEPGGDRVREALRHDELLREATVHAPAGELGLLAQVLASAATEAARSAGAVQPGDADAFAAADAGGCAGLHPFAHGL